jgi:hypothetical protein
MNKNNIHSVEQQASLSWSLCYHYLYLRDRIYLSSTSKQFYTLINNEFIWRYSSLQPSNYSQLTQLLNHSTNNLFKCMYELDFSLLGDFLINSSDKLIISNYIVPCLNNSFIRLRSFNLSSFRLLNDLEHSIIINSLSYQSLTNLNLSQNDTIGLATFKTIGTYLTKLRNLNISFCDNVTDLCLLSLLGNQCLETLDMSYCRLITDNSLFILRFLSNLSHLTLDWCNNITANGINYFISKVIHINVANEFINGLIKQFNIQSNTTINLNDMKCIHDLLISNINNSNSYVTIPNIHYLSCRGCNSINNNAIKLLSNFKELKSFNLRSCNGINNNIFYSLIDLKDSLNDLDLSDCSLLQGNHNNLSNLAHLYNLTSLNVWNINSLDDQGLYYITRCNKIKILKISSASAVTDTGISYLRELIYLENLDLIELNNISENSFVHLSHLSALLTQLNLSRCNQLTNNGLMYISKLIHLNSLNISQCEAVSDEGLMNSIALLTNLTSLQCNNIHNLTQQSIEYVLTRLTALRYLDIRYCKQLQSLTIQSKNSKCEVDNDSMMSDYSSDQSVNNLNDFSYNSNNSLHTSSNNQNENHILNEEFSHSMYSNDYSNHHNLIAAAKNPYRRNIPVIASVTEREDISINSNLSNYIAHTSVNSAPPQHSPTANSSSFLSENSKRATQNNNYFSADLSCPMPR